jgi:hypothetical protein
MPDKARWWSMTPEQRKASGVKAMARGARIKARKAAEASAALKAADATGTQSVAATNPGANRGRAHS